MAYGLGVAGQMMQDLRNPAFRCPDCGCGTMEIAVREIRKYQIANGRLGVGWSDASPELVGVRCEGCGAELLDHPADAGATMRSPTVSPWASAGRARRLTATARPEVDNVPGMTHSEECIRVARDLEREPGGAGYLGHGIAWIADGRGEGWLHEVDKNSEWRFETLVAALTFIDVLES